MEVSPDVTVVIGAYNALPYLERCLRSVEEQTSGMDRLEVVAVDDGSTDGTGAVLDAFAARHPRSVRVVRQRNSGGPSGPRNRGLELATGRYVFFLDADDHLGTEALERMTAMADAQSSDVVLGRLAAVNGRSVPSKMFRRTQPHADLYTSWVWWTLSAYKLFRRAHIRELRFPTEYRIGEDQLFTGRAMLTARVISVVADYDCYHLVKRDDGANLTATDRDMAGRMRMLARMCAMVAEHVEPGPRRDHLLHRQFGVDLRSWSGPRILEQPRGAQEQTLAMAAEIVGTWGAEGLLRRLPAALRLRYHLLGRGLLEQALEAIRFQASGRKPDIVTERGAAFAAYPHWRDRELDVPDDVFDITRQLRPVHRLDSVEVADSRVRLSGRAGFEEFGGLDAPGNPESREEPGDPGGPVEPAEPGRPSEPGGTAGPGGPARFEVLLRERRTKSEFPVSTECRGDGFTADLDLATAAAGEPLPRGLWDVFLLITVRGVRREVRFGSKRSAAVDTRTRTRVVHLGGHGPTAVTPYYTEPYGNLTFDVAEMVHRLGPVRVDVARWARPDALLVHGVAGDGTAEIADGALVVRLRAGSGEERDHPASVRGGRFEVLVPTTELPMGTWTLQARLALSSGVRETPVPAAGVPATRWRRGLRLVYARPTGGGEALELQVGPVSVATGLRRRLSP